MNYALRIKKLNHLRWACRGVVVATIAVSVWANSLIAGGDSRSIIISILPPLLTMLGFELVSRIPLHGAWTTRFIRPVATAIVTGIGAFLSYYHQKEAFARYSNDVNTAKLLPIAIDGLMVIAAVSLIELNAGVEHLENRQAGLDVKLATREPIQATNVRTILKGKQEQLSGKERIALILAKQPDIPIKRLAIEAGVSEGYAGTLAGQLRRTRDAVVVD